MEGEKVNEGFVVLDTDEEGLWVSMDNCNRFKRGPTTIDVKTRVEPDLATIIPGFVTDR